MHEIGSIIASLVTQVVPGSARRATSALYLLTPHALRLAAISVEFCFAQTPTLLGGSVVAGSGWDETWYWVLHAETIELRVAAMGSNEHDFY